MRIIGTLIGLLFSTQVFAGTLVCEPEPYENNSGRGIVDILVAQCQDWENDVSYNVELKSRGISLRFGAIQSFLLICPFKSHDQVLGEYVGAKIEAEIIIGFKGGTFYASDKACIMGGLQGGAIGAGFTGGTLKITKGHKYYRGYRD